LLESELPVARQINYFLGQVLQPQAHGIAQVTCGFDDGLARRCFELLNESKVNRDVLGYRLKRVVVQES